MFGTRSRSSLDLIADADAVVDMVVDMVVNTVVDMAVDTDRDVGRLKADSFAVVHAPAMAVGSAPSPWTAATGWSNPGSPLQP